MVRWGNSLSMIFRCANGIRQGGQLSPLLHNVYTDGLNRHLQATRVGCYVGGAWVNSLSYADDMVLLHTLSGRTGSALVWHSEVADSRLTQCSKSCDLQPSLQCAIRGARVVLPCVGWGVRPVNWIYRL